MSINLANDHGAGREATQNPKKLCFYRDCPVIKPAFDDWHHQKGSTPLDLVRVQLIATFSQKHNYKYTTAELSASTKGNLLMVSLHQDLRRELDAGKLSNLVLLLIYKHHRSDRHDPQNRCKFLNKFNAISYRRSTTTCGGQGTDRVSLSAKQTYQ